MHTCTKTYQDIPFAHRQPNHNGHCAWIHGHNWTFIITFKATELDACGFVVDFGKLKYIKAWFDDVLDHALVLNKSDPALEFIRSTLGVNGGMGTLAKIVTLPDCSAEGLAKYVFHVVDDLVAKETQGRVSVRSVVCEEDAHNKATYWRTNDDQ